MIPEYVFHVFLDILQESVASALNIIWPLYFMISAISKEILELQLIINNFFIT